ncbi:hypothetical protein [Thalassospira xiamenensis]|uniref:hypothetical protein n=1 Tax=Thalassospira xiamenensis TaxID=220697 RepID=UPI000AA50A66|nr:hypothetical protein [Thalassospira xiamenensis]
MATVMRGDCDLAVPVGFTADLVEVLVGFVVAVPVPPETEFPDFFGISWVTRGELVDLALP